MMKLKFLPFEKGGSNQRSETDTQVQRNSDEEVLFFNLKLNSKDFPEKTIWKV